MTKHRDNDNPNHGKNSRSNSLTFTEGKTQLPMKSNKRCCHFITATNDSKFLKQNNKAMLAGRR